MKTAQILKCLAWGALSLSSAANAGLFDNIKEAATQQLGTTTTTPASATGTSALSASALSGLGLPAIGGNTAGNAAGVLEYCVKNNYLGANGTNKVKSALMSKMGLGSNTQDSNYKSGTAGLLQGTDGSSFNLDNLKSNLKSNLKEKACDYVLENAKSLI